MPRFFLPVSLPLHSPEIDRAPALSEFAAPPIPAIPELVGEVAHGVMALGKVEVCHVNDPAAIVDRIADSMSATLAEEGGRMPGQFLMALRAEWDRGRSSVMPMQASTSRTQKQETIRGPAEAARLP
jgi:hypothetical protein